ncbi:hypothetical protein IQ07DRAFT_638912 [Pyrenochaeta sp. DS3sAY3a]|nr:hypothetical protein IQ07DRAFT_638912 [Pyrenochaeta sp. DS3sAY3a]
MAGSRIEPNPTAELRCHIWISITAVHNKKPLGSPLGPFFKTEKGLIIAHISNFIKNNFDENDLQALIANTSINIRYGPAKILCFSILRGNHEGSGFNAVAKVLDLEEVKSTTIYSVHFRPIPGTFSIPSASLSEAQLIALYCDSEEPVFPVGGRYLVSFANKNVAAHYIRDFVLGDDTEHRKFTKTVLHGVVFGIRKPYRTTESTEPEPIQLVIIEAVQVTKEERKCVPY